MDNATPVMVMGMVWYKAEHYDAIRRVMADGHKLPATFHEWRMQAETGEKKNRRDGKVVIRAIIDPETFPDWCRARGLDIDAKARMQYAAAVAHEKMLRSHAEGDGSH
ncbi:MAG: hypothetical protein H3C27_15645 [Opitutaceae bacterium]|nr:hypothetical protein [Opitutaceae bacterium]